MADKFRWGIIGTGRIANDFAEGLPATECGELVAVASRSQEKADEFGEKHNCPHRYGSYEAIVGDAQVDAVYIATPHHLHVDNSVMCLEAGKAVLCEKPLTINADEARRIVTTARDRKVFCMEAMWARLLPAQTKMRELIADGAIGEPQVVLASFAFRASFRPEHRLFDPAMGGGGLLDVGVYGVSLASSLFGAPAGVCAQGVLGETGVDEIAALSLSYPGGKLASLTCGVRCMIGQFATIVGTEGRLEVNNPFHPKHAGVTLRRRKEEPQTFEPESIGNGFNYEADEVARCVRDGKLESDLLPLDESVRIMQTLDTARRQMGVRYPMETTPQEGAR